jgi:hypothetical protein
MLILNMVCLTVATPGKDINCKNDKNDKLKVPIHPIVQPRVVTPKHGRPW